MEKKKPQAEKGLPVKDHYSKTVIFKCKPALAPPGEFIKT